ncbi:MAG: DNA polymerase III subunit epsilon [Candidatus Dasytiphilus stammeri]
MITNINRKIVLDIETTGMNSSYDIPFYEGHRIIEIGAVEIINRCLTGNNFHVYLNPNRSIDPKAFYIHGITDNFLIDKPVFSDVADNLFAYIKNSELIIHNAPFDISFIEYEYNRLNRSYPKLSTICCITDSLLLARALFPGKRNSLDALCTRYKIDNSKRILHGALLDAETLAKVYLSMSVKQSSFFFPGEKIENKIAIKRKTLTGDHYHKPLRVIKANSEELLIHESYLDMIRTKKGSCLWPR